MAGARSTSCGRISRARTTAHRRRRCQPERGLFATQRIADRLGLQNFEGVGQVRAPAATPVLPVFGFTVIQLDMSYLRGQMIPALAERHFIDAGGDMLPRRRDRRR